MSSRLPPGARLVPLELRGASALELFRAGFDTFDIKVRFNITEAEAHKLVSSSLSAALGRSNPYSTNSLPAVREAHRWPSGRVAYAGRE